MERDKKRRQLVGIPGGKNLHMANSRANINNSSWSSSCFSTPHGGGVRCNSGNNHGITDRFIPNSTSQKAYRASPTLKNFDISIPELLHRSPSPTHLSSPGFFTDLRGTGYYSSIGNSLSSSVSAPPTGTDSLKTKPALHYLRHKEYIAEALGFHSPDRVFQFSPHPESRSSHNSTSRDVSFTSLQTFANHIRMDPLLSTLPPRQAVVYLASHAFSNSLKSKSFIKTNGRPAKRVKSHIPYRVLDAPSLRNDFYSNLISWSNATGNIAVGLGSAVYLWSDTNGAITVLQSNYLHNWNDFVTCVSFSAREDFLIIGTKQGRLLLFDQSENPEQLEDGSRKPLTELPPLGKGVCCVAWFTKDPRNRFMAGDESGDVRCFEITKNEVEITEPPSNDEDGLELCDVSRIETIIRTESMDSCDINQEIRLVEEDVFQASEIEEASPMVEYKMELTVRFKCHSQQVCGLSLNEDTNQLAVGGNDNACTIWDIKDIESPIVQFILPHNAAVKAVAFCPWSKSLLATGGGSKDRTIRFWHTQSGTLLDQVKTPGQITSLIWSTRKKQIVSTFGFGDVDNPILVTVYSYPTVEPLVHVHATTTLRVLSAVPSPDFGSICVATNDETVRFYELWNVKDCVISEAQENGVYGSDLIEYCEGIEKSGDVIR